MNKKITSTENTAFDRYSFLAAANIWRLLEPFPFTKPYWKKPLCRISSDREKMTKKNSEEWRHNQLSPCSVTSATLTMFRFNQSLLTMWSRLSYTINQQGKLMVGTFKNINGISTDRKFKDSNVVVVVCLLTQGKQIWRYIMDQYTRRCLIRLKSL